MKVIFIFPQFDVSVSNVSIKNNQIQNAVMTSGNMDDCRLPVFIGSWSCNDMVNFNESSHRLSTCVDCKLLMISLWLIENPYVRLTVEHKLDFQKTHLSHFGSGIQRVRIKEMIALFKKW